MNLVHDLLIGVTQTHCRRIAAERLAHAIILEQSRHRRYKFTASIGVKLSSPPPRGWQELRHFCADDPQQHWAKAPK